MAEAKKMTDKALSYEKYAEAEKLMLEEAYIAPLYQTGIALLQRDYVSGIIKPAFGVDYVFTYADVDKADKTLNLRDASDIPTLDVSLASDTVSSQALNNTMEGLVTIGDNNTILPGVATSWESSEDGLTWTFNLRQDSVWSNGDKVTAHDFVYSWKRTIDPATASTYAFIMYDIVGAEDANLNGGSLDDVGVKAIDDYTLEVTLNRPITYFAELMTFKTFLPQNQAFVEACGDSYGTDLDKQVYNGAFTLSSWKKEDQWTFTKNQNYWNKDAVNLEAINVKVAKESGAAVNLYESGDIDRVTLSSEYVDKYKDDPNFQTLSKPSTYMLMINGSNNNK
jgi:oligopeptide transport system substrate-binding protein